MYFSGILLVLVSVLPTTLAQRAFCTSTAGLAGECISTSDCTANGGTSDPGNLCPGGNDIQCCTYGSCKGTPGTCQPARSCGDPEPGDSCPGPDRIQCCCGDAPHPDIGTDCPPDVNQATLDLVKGFEGFEPEPYEDVGGNPTVGYGHLCEQDGCTELPYTYPITEEQGEDLLADDLTEAENCIGYAVTVPLNDNQYGALVSWAFNVGCGSSGASGSTLVQRLNAGEDPNTVAEEELPQWNKSNGEVVDGLTRRRKAEIKLFETQCSKRAIPC